MIPRATKKNKEYADMLCKENADMMIGAVTYIHKCKVQGIRGIKTLRFAEISTMICATDLTVATYI